MAALALAPSLSSLPHPFPFARDAVAGFGRWLAFRRRQHRARAAMDTIDAHTARDIGLSRQRA